MKKRQTNSLAVGVIVLIGVICIFFVSYRVAVIIDYRNCYIRVNENIDVRVQAVLESGMSQTDVLASLQEIAPVQVLEQSEVISKNEIVQYIRMGVCTFFENSVYYSIRYSIDGHFIEIERFQYYD